MTEYEREYHTAVNRHVKMYTATKTFELKMSPSSKNDIQFDCQNS